MISLLGKLAWGKTRNSYYGDWQTKTIDGKDIDIPSDAKNGDIPNSAFKGGHQCAQAAHPNNQLNAATVSRPMGAGVASLPLVTFVGHKKDGLYAEVNFNNDVLSVYVDENAHKIVAPFLDSNEVSLKLVYLAIALRALATNMQDPTIDLIKKSVNEMLDSARKSQGHVLQEIPFASTCDAVYFLKDIPDFDFSNQDILAGNPIDYFALNNIDLDVEDDITMNVVGIQGNPVLLNPTIQIPVLNGTPPSGNKTNKTRKPRNAQPAAQTTPAAPPVQLTPEEIAMIPEDEGIKLPRNLSILANEFVRGTFETALFFGEPGTGKTTMANAVFSQIQKPTHVVNFSVNMEESELIGDYVPDPKGNGFIFLPGAIVQAAKEGHAVIFEELNYAKPGVLGALNSFLTGPGILRLRNGDIIKKHPGFRLIACVNFGLEGTKRMNRALIARFQKQIRFKNLSVDEMAKIVDERSGIGLSFATLIARVIEKTVIKLQENELEGNASVREAIGWAKSAASMAEIMKSPINNRIIGEAAFDAYLNNVNPEDLDLQDKIVKDCINPILNTTLKFQA